MHRHKARFLFIFLTILMVSIFLWSIWPLPTATQSLCINPDYLNRDALLACPTLKYIESYDFIIQSPKRTWKAEPAYLWLMLKQREAPLFDETASTIVIETQLDLPSVVVQPGSRLITPFQGAEDQTILYSITAYQEGTVEGTLWIRAVRGAGTESSIDAITLFSVPISLQVISILGMPPVLVRYLCLLGLLLVLAVGLRNKLKGQE